MPGGPATATLSEDQRHFLQHRVAIFGAVTAALYGPALVQRESGVGTGDRTIEIDLLRRKQSQSGGVSGA